MPPMPTINLMQPIGGACVVNAEELETVGRGWRNRDGQPHPPSEIPRERLEKQQAELTQLLATVHGIADGLRKLHEETLASNRVEIARLAMEIARKILQSKIGKGDYEIQAILEEALKQAPTRQNIVVHLNPEDLPRCQQLQQETPQGPLAELELVADWNIGRGECLVETPKGVIRSFLEEHLDRIREAIERAE
jgi:flagellar assembly protein FliH